MRNKSLSILLFFVLLIVVIVVISAIILYDSNKQEHSTPTPTPTIVSSSPTPVRNQIIFPAGGETLIPGNSYTLKWEGGGKTISIFLVATASAAKGTSVSIVDRISAVMNTGSYQYSLPKNLRSGNYYFQIGDIKSNLFMISSGLVIPGFTSSCSVQNLSSTLSFQGAAGNMYGTAQIKNLSSKSCYVSGKNFLTIQFSSPTSNIKLAYKTPESNQTYLLGPQESIYALIHYPNGPQCSSSIKQVSTSFTYQIAQGALLTFHDMSGKQMFLITGCSAQSDITQVDISAFSSVNPGA